MPRQRRSVNRATARASPRATARATARAKGPAQRAPSRPPSFYMLGVSAKGGKHRSLRDIIANGAKKGPKNSSTRIVLKVKVRRSCDDEAAGPDAVHAAAATLIDISRGRPCDRSCDRPCDRPARNT